MATQADKDAEHLVAWLKSQVPWADDSRSLVFTDARQRRYYRALLAMSEEDFRMFVMAGLVRSLRLPLMPPPEQEKAA